MYAIQQDYAWVSSQPSAIVEDQPLFSGIARAPHPKLQFALQCVGCHGRVFDLHKPIEVLLYRDDDVWVCEWEGILSATCELREAPLAFCEQFSIFWDEIAQAPDETLTKRAQATKRAMLDVVKSAR
jgi:hypothetical protein